MKNKLNKGFYLLVATLVVAMPKMALGYACVLPGIPPGCSNGGGGNGSGWSTSNYGGTGLPDGTVAGIVSNILFWLLGIFGFIGVIGFVISGILYLTAAGDAKQEEKAKKAMTMSIIGVIVGLIGLVVIKMVDGLLRGSAV